MEGSEEAGLRVATHRVESGQIDNTDEMSAGHSQISFCDYGCCSVQAVVIPLGGFIGGRPVNSHDACGVDSLCIYEVNNGGESEGRRFSPTRQVSSTRTSHSFSSLFMACLSFSRTTSERIPSSVSVHPRLSKSMPKSANLMFSKSTLLAANSSMRLMAM